MGDMIRHAKCGTYHYRNDPCPDDGPTPSGLDVALQAIDQAGIDREHVSQITLSLLEPPSVSVRYEAFREAFRGREVETRLRDEWEHLEVYVDGVKFSSCHQIAVTPLPKKTKVLT